MDLILSGKQIDPQIFVIVAAAAAYCAAQGAAVVGDRRNPVQKPING
jgi:hypothetical protein